MGLLEAGCLLEDSHCQLGLASIKDISLECFLMRKCPDANNLLIWLIQKYRALMALGTAIAKAWTWESPSGLKRNFKVGRQTGERSRETDYTEVILQSLPVIPRQTASALLLPNRTVCAQWTFGLQNSNVWELFSVWKFLMLTKKNMVVETGFLSSSACASRVTRAVLSISNNEFVSEVFFHTLLSFYLLMLWHLLISAE